MNRLKTLVVTTSRADYGLLHPLIVALENDDYFDVHLIATGGHLSDIQGSTIDIIRGEGFKNIDTVDMDINGDRETDICNYIATGLKSFSYMLQHKKPDIIIVLGDRYELYSFCIAAVIHKIPIAHIHGGEITQGAIDDCIRHAITKMATIHFPTIEEYGKRIIQMGESPDRVHVVGALGMDNIKNISLMTLAELSEYTKVDFTNDIALMTYHPVTLDNYENAGEQVKEILDALLETHFKTLITMPNADAGSMEIYHVIRRYIEHFPEKFFLVKNLGQKAYLSAMKYSKLMVGNSSSGIIESAAFKLPVVNIGDRQKGRHKPKNVIDCSCEKQSILNAVEEAVSKHFQNQLIYLDNPYGTGCAADQIKIILKNINFHNHEDLLKKRFVDLDIQW